MSGSCMPSVCPRYPRQGLADHYLTGWHLPDEPPCNSVAESGTRNSSFFTHLPSQPIKFVGVPATLNLSASVGRRASRCQRWAGLVSLRQLLFASPIGLTGGGSSQERTVESASFPEGMRGQ